MTTYYAIDESAARLAREMNSFRPYEPNRLTNEYRGMVDKAAEIAAREKAKRPEYAEDIDRLLEKYSKRLADWFNESSRIESMCPSVMVSGGSNFPVAKKQKQNERRDAHYKKYEEIEQLLRQMERVGTGGIQSGDANAIEKLEQKLKNLEEQQETMKAINAYYRKHKTLDGCELVSEKTLEVIKRGMENSWRQNPVPFESYTLTNNNANIRSTKRRLESLKAAKAQGTVEKEAEVDGVKIVENTELMRIQIVFDGKPEADVRDILKKNGFRWAPSQGAWQRQLNGNGKWAAERVMEELKK